MPEQKKTVFISCGQWTREERALGEEARQLVNELTPFEGYFAQDQVSLKTLTENVLSRLYESVGLIAIMHHRGLVARNSGSDEIAGEKLIRGSLWVEQEIAVAAFMEQILERPLYVALFIQRGIAIDGIRKQLHLNPVEFDTAGEVTEHLRKLLTGWKTPRYTSDEERRKQVDSVELSVRIVQAWSLSVTIQISNFSDLPAQIRGIALRSNDTRLCDPIYPPPGVNWSLQPRGGLPINFRTSKDLGHELIMVNGRQRTYRLTQEGTEGIFGPANRFNPIIAIELRCEILGVERVIKENCSVQVNLTTAEINSL